MNSMSEKIETKNQNESLEIYNEKELLYLDKYLPLVKNSVDVKFLLIIRKMNCMKSF
jgi:hypothetical protein